jgi:hypothetical protein
MYPVWTGFPLDNFRSRRKTARRLFRVSAARRARRSDERECSGTPRPPALSWPSLGVDVQLLHRGIALIGARGLRAHHRGSSVSEISGAPRDVARRTASPQRHRQAGPAPDRGQLCNASGPREPQVQRQIEELLVELSPKPDAPAVIPSYRTPRRGLRLRQRCKPTSSVRTEPYSRSRTG